MRATLLSIASVSLLMSCGDDEMLVPHTGTSWVASVDSACLMLPNVFTPNGDGMNDELVALCEFAVSGTLSVRTLTLEPIFHTTQLYDDWDGRMADGTPAPSGWYFATAHVRTESGEDLYANVHLRLVRHPESECLPIAFEIITRDMIDPRRCAELLYTTNDQFIRCQ